MSGASPWAKTDADAIESMRPGTPVLQIGPEGDLQRPVTLDDLRDSLGPALARRSLGT